MKAIILREPGGPEQLRFEDVPVPEPQDGQVLIQLKAAALNRRDLLVRSREQYRAIHAIHPWV
jgi:zinc-binding alcohol dehydrogenase/oxidoreductase